MTVEEFNGYPETPQSLGPPPPHPSSKALEHGPHPEALPRGLAGKPRRPTRRGDERPFAALVVSRAGMADRVAAASATGEPGPGDPDHY